jgi:hypothetical protein
MADDPPKKDVTLGPVQQRIGGSGGIENLVAVETPIESDAGLTGIDPQRHFQSAIPYAHPLPSVGEKQPAALTVPPEQAAPMPPTIAAVLNQPTPTASTAPSETRSPLAPPSPVTDLAGKLSDVGNLAPPMPGTLTVTINDSLEPLPNEAVGFSSGAATASDVGSNAGQPVTWVNNEQLTGESEPDPDLEREIFEDATRKGDAKGRGARTAPLKFTPVSAALKVSGFQTDTPPASTQSSAPGEKSGPQFSNRRELQRWLSNKPQEWAVAIAARSALRAVPALADAFTLDALDFSVKQLERSLPLTVFRASAAAWVASAYPANFPHHGVAERAADEAANAAPNNSARAAAAAAYAVVANAAERAAHATDYAAQSAAKVTDETSIWDFAADDARILEHGVAPQNLALHPLWPGGPPFWAREMWERLWHELLNSNSDWEAWFKWYEARLNGGPANPTLEVLRVVIADEFWHEGPRGVNSRLMQEVEPVYDDAQAVDSIPPQVASATLFVLDAEGRIDLAPDPPLADDLQREIYQEVRYKAVALSEQGHNQLADLSEPIGRFLAAAPERLEAVSITRLWSRGNTLRLRIRAHETATTSTDPTDPALLPALVEGMLRDLVETYNLFIISDAKARELDQVRLGPQERDAAQAEVDAALPIVRAVQRAEGLATPAAIEALTEQAEAARNAPAGINGDQAIDLSRKTSGNFVVEILRLALARVRAESGFALKEIRAGAYRGVGAIGAVTGIPAAFVYHQEIISFIVDNADALKMFVDHAFHNPALIRIIEVISQSASGGI